MTARAARCARCGSTEDLELHHVTPRCEGGENGDTEILCRLCHHRHHLENGDYTRWKERDLQGLFDAFGEEEARALLAHWGRRGGQKLAQERGSGYMARIGRRGGQALVEKYGQEHMRRLGYLRHGMKPPETGIQ